MNKLAKERIIFDNYEFPDRSENINTIIENGYSEDEVTENMIFHWGQSELDMWWEDEVYRLNEFFKDQTLLLFGSIGRWNGVVKGFSTYSSFNELLSDVGKDCSYFKFYDKNGHFYITCSHHDGRNHYEIKILTEDGKKYFENWEYSNRVYDVEKQLINRYSRLPHYAHKVFGCKAKEYEPVTKENIITKLNNEAKSYYM